MLDAIVCFTLVKQLQLFKFPNNPLCLRRGVCNDTRVHHVKKIVTNLQFAWVASSMILGLAFLFSHDKINILLITIQGMMRAFCPVGLWRLTMHPFIGSLNLLRWLQRLPNRMRRAIVLFQTELHSAMNRAKIETKESTQLWTKVIVSTICSKLPRDNVRKVAGAWLKKT